MLYFLVKMLMYLGMVLGMWLLVGEWIKVYFTNKSRQIKIKTRIRNRRIIDEEININNPILDKFKLIIDIAHGGKISLITYIAIEIGIFTLVILFLYIINNLNIANILYALMISLFFFLCTLGKFYFSRIKTSYEGERLLVEFINQYNINNGNIIETIDLTASNLKEEIYSKKALSRLSFNIKGARNSEEIDKYIDDFAYSINTQWGFLLAQNISSALKINNNISESLNDILQDIKHIKDSIEKAKRENNEGFVMLVFLAPFIYIFTTYYALKVMDITLSYYIRQQLTIGFRLMTLTIFLYLVGIFMMLVLKKPKFD